MRDQECCLEELETVVHQLVRLIHVFERDLIETEEFSSAQYYTLSHIQRSPGITVRELSDKLFTAISTTSRVVDLLVRKGYVKRREALEDRRVVLLDLTNQGVEAMTKLQGQLSRYYQEILEHIPALEVEAT